MQRRPRQPITTLEPSGRAPAAFRVLGFALVAACLAGAALNLAQARFPWPEDFVSNDLEAMLRTFVTGALGAALIVVLREPKLEARRVRRERDRSLE